MVADGFGWPPSEIDRFTVDELSFWAARARERLKRFASRGF